MSKEMTVKTPYGKNYVDHYLQLDILDRLVRSATPIRFSELKEPGVENSLFMYHINKLIRRGIVAKHVDGFSLTSKGANWVNVTGVASLEPRLLPRPLVQFIIRHETSVLLSVRKGQLGDHLNSYLLPGGLHKYGMSADETARALLGSFFPDIQTTPHFISVVEMIVEQDVGLHHAISHVFEVTLPDKYMPKADDLFDFEWIELVTITQRNERFSHEKLLLEIIAKVKEGHLGVREVLRADS